MLDTIRAATTYRLVVLSFTLVAALGILTRCPQPRWE